VRNILSVGVPLQSTYGCKNGIGKERNIIGTEWDKMALKETIWDKMGLEKRAKYL